MNTLKLNKIQPEKKPFLNLLHLSDGFVFIALWFTGELSSPFFEIILSLSLLSLFFNFKINKKILSFLIFFTTVICMTIIFKKIYLPIKILLNIAPLFILLLSLSEDKNVKIGWRIGLEFVVLTLCASISYEFILPVLISLFILNASLLISIYFIKNEFQKKLKFFPHLFAQKISKKFILKSLNQSLYILIFATIIFPILPRAPTKFNFKGQTSSEIGFTEEINTSQWLNEKSNRASSIALRVYNNTNRPFEDLIPMNLLRTRTLDLYTGETWIATPQKNLVYPSPFLDQNHYDLKMIRESIQSDYLPVPYLVDTLTVMPATELNNDNRVALSNSMEWKNRTKKNDSVEYKITLKSNMTLPKDEPKKAHTIIENNKDYQTLKELSFKLFDKKKTTLEKINTMRTFFNENHFKPALPGEESTQPSERKTSALIHFLLSSKSGHCELFSASAALLLRFSGVPTRLVSGFRIGRYPENEILTIRMSDAHAWVEIYDEKKGWIPVDFTPKELSDVGIKEWLRDHYDYLSGRWYELITNTDPFYPLFKEKISSILSYPTTFWSGGIIFILLIGLILFRFIKKWKLKPFKRKLIFLKLKKKFILKLFSKKRSQWNENLWEDLVNEGLYSRPEMGKDKRVLQKMNAMLSLKKSTC